ncbi:phenylalanine--tRNA ligase subunit beta [archaeon]|nr:phenylalanine--tRNA ligase subunit beta [archaeon]
MTILTVDRKEFEKKAGKVTKELEDKITMMGTPIEEVSDAEVSVEVFPNRPDLLSMGNFARAVNQFNGKGKVASFKINKPESDFVVTIDKSVKSVRPHTVCAIVKGLKFDDAKIKEIVDIQEKLHNSLGRKRKKLAIGIYPLDKIKLPIRFIGRKPEDIKFLPLEAKAEMTGRQILRGHPAGREYADLLKDMEVFPIFVDANDEILSMPPIINSEKTGRIDESTKEIFIECSGYNLVYLKKCLNIIVAALDSMGGKVYAMDVKDSKDKDFVSPDMSAEELSFKIEDIEKTLGISLKEKDVVGYLARMGIGYDVKKKVALIPAYRADILHWVDLAEEVAIAYGYDKFVPEIPEISTIAEENPVDKLKRTIGNVLAGVGLLETSSYHLTTKKNVKRMHYEFNDFIEVEDSKTERDVLRIDLLTNLLQIASENSDASYPQKVFEMGTVFARDENSSTGVFEKERLAIALADENIRFTEMKQILDYLFKMLDVEYSIEAVDNSNYIIGRCGKIVVKGKEVGLVGEIAPRVLKNWKIKMPVVACEMGLGFLMEE